MSHVANCPEAEALDTVCVGEEVNFAILNAQNVRPDAAVEHDPNADVLCTGGVWDTSAGTDPDFPINESFENTSFDTGDPNWTLQGVAGLTGPNGSGRLRLSNPGAFTNGAAIYNPTFSNADNITTEVNWASWGATDPGGDGLMQFFSDGSCPPQSIPLGGGGGLGLGNIECAFLAVVLDEFGGSGPPGGFNFNYLKVRVNCPGNPMGANTQVVSIPLAPQTINNHDRTNEPRLRTSIVTEAGETFISVSILWPGDANYTVYLNRFNVTTACAGAGFPGVVAPPTLRTGFSASSGGAFQSIHELHGLRIGQAGRQAWRALQISNDTPSDPCSAMLTAAQRRVRIQASVLNTITPEPGVVFNPLNNETWFWLVNSATNTVVQQSNKDLTAVNNGVQTSLSLDFIVPAGDLSDYRLYLGSDRRDSDGFYTQEWENFSLSAVAEACSCPTCSEATNVTSSEADLNGIADFVPTDRFVRFAYGTTPGGPYPNTTANEAGTNTDQQVVSHSISGLSPLTDHYFVLQVLDTDGTTVLEQSTEECSFQTTAIPPDCLPASDVRFTTATLNGQGNGPDNGSFYRFRYGTVPGGPYSFQSPLIPATPADPEPLSYDITSLQDNTTYYFMVELVGADRTTVIATSDECNFTTPESVKWCGTHYDENDCMFVNAENGEPYHNCWPAAIRDGFPGEGQA